MSLEFNHLPLLLAIPGAIVLALVIWGVTHAASDFRIVVKRGRIRFFGRFPPGFRPDTSRLLREEMAVNRVVIQGTWSPGHVLRLSIRGQVDEAQRQRIRNFLKITLGG